MSKHYHEPVPRISYIQKFISQVLTLLLVSCLLPNLQVAYLVKFCMHTLSHTSKLQIRTIATSSLPLSLQDKVAYIKHKIHCDVAS
jgi:hypothetical protein